MDFSVFVDPDAEVKYAWKRRRDTGVRGYSPAEVTEEITRREKDYETYIAPQRCLADAVIRISSSRYGKEKGEAENIYRISLLQHRMDRMIEDIDLNIDLYSLLSFHDHNFMIEFSTEDVACARMRALTFDGEMNYENRPETGTKHRAADRGPPDRDLREPHDGHRDRSCPAHPLVADHPPADFFAGPELIRPHGIPVTIVLVL